MARTGAKGTVSSICCLTPFSHIVMLHTFSSLNKARYPHLVAFSNWVAEKNDLTEQEMQLYWVKQAFFSQLAHWLTELFKLAHGENAVQVLPSELADAKSAQALLDELEQAIAQTLTQPDRGLMAPSNAPLVAKCRQSLQALAQHDSPQLTAVLQGFLREIAQHQACANEDEAGWEVTSWFLEAQAMALFVQHLGADVVGALAARSANESSSESEQKVLLYGWLCDAFQKTNLEQSDALADLARYLMLEATYLGLSSPSQAVDRQDLVEAMAEMFPAFSMLD